MAHLPSLQGLALSLFLLLHCLSCILLNLWERALDVCYLLLSCVLSHVVKGGPKPLGYPPQAAAPGFKSRHKSPCATPFLTPPTIGCTCQHPTYFQSFLANIVSPSRCGPTAQSKPSPSSCSGAITRGTASQFCHRSKSLPSPWLQAWPQLFNKSTKLASCYRYVKELFLHIRNVGGQLLICKITQWPCSLCPISQSGLVGVGISCICIFPRHPKVWTLFQILHLGVPGYSPLQLGKITHLLPRVWQVFLLYIS